MGSKLAQIRRCLRGNGEILERGGICCVAKALETRRIDLRDFDRSENFHTSLKRNDRDMEGMISCTVVTHSQPIRIRRLE